MFSIELFNFIATGTGIYAKDRLRNSEKVGELPVDWDAMSSTELANWIFQSWKVNWESEGPMKKWGGIRQEKPTIYFDVLFWSAYEKYRKDLTGWLVEAGVEQAFEELYSEEYAEDIKQEFPGIPKYFLKELLTAAISDDIMAGHYF